MIIAQNNKDQSQHKRMKENVLHNISPKIGKMKYKKRVMLWKTMAITKAGREADLPRSAV